MMSVGTVTLGSACSGTGSVIRNRLAVGVCPACGGCGLGARDGAWSGDGLVVRRREGAAIAQYHRADSCRVR